MAQHLIQDISLWHLEDGLLLFVTDLLVHDFNDLVLVLDQQLHFFDVVDLLGHVLRQIIEPFYQQLLVLGQSLDVSLVSLDMSVQVSDLRGLQLNLLVQVSSLLSNDIEFLNLVFDDGLSLLQRRVYSQNLVLDLLNLLLGVNDHLVAVFDLLLQVVRKLLLLSLLEVVQKKLLSLLEETSLFV